MSYERACKWYIVTRDMKIRESVCFRTFYVCMAASRATKAPINFWCSGYAAAVLGCFLFLPSGVKTFCFIVKTLQAARLSKTDACPYFLRKIHVLRISSAEQRAEYYCNYECCQKHISGEEGPKDASEKYLQGLIKIL